MKLILYDSFHSPTAAAINVQFVGDIEVNTGMSW